MAAINMDVTGVPTSTPFEPIPEGWYQVVINNSEIQSAKSGRGQKLILECEVLAWADDPAKQPATKIVGRKPRIYLNLWHDSAKAVEIATEQLSSIGHAVGVLQIADSSMLHGKPFEAKFNVDGSNNDFKGARPVAAGATAAPGPAAYAPGAMSAPAPAPGMPAQPGPGPAAGAAPAAAPPTAQPPAPVAAPAPAGVPAAPWG